MLKAMDIKLNIKVVFFNPINLVRCLSRFLCDFNHMEITFLFRNYMQF